MGKLKKLQEKYVKGEITAAEYTAQVGQLLTDGDIDQDQHDEALDYDPEHERPQYSQADVDAMIASRAIRMVRKALKDGGVTVDADNKTLLTSIAEKLKAAADGNTSLNSDDQAKLTAATEKATTLEEKLKDLAIENAVLKSAGTYNPVNPTQVVRAIRLDYMDDMDYDETTGVVDAKSVARALKKVHGTEPNLFKAGTDDNNNGNPNNDDAFKSKGPGGGTAGGDKTDAKVTEALSMLGISTK